MFIGHFGVGFAAKRVVNRPSLGTLFLASQFIDLLWPLFLLLGLEKVKIDPGNTVVTPLDFVYYPFSHGLLSVLIWGLIFGVIYYFIKKDIKSAVILGLLVLSHWILDFFTHRPDLPIVPWSDIKTGLGIWNSLIFTLLFEGLIFGTGVYLYYKYTRSKNKSGTYGTAGLILFLLIVYFMNIFGTPPPSEEPLAYVGFSQWLLVLWAYWIDRNRTFVTKDN